MFPVSKNILVQAEVIFDFWAYPWNYIFLQRIFLDQLFISKLPDQRGQKQSKWHLSSGNYLSLPSRCPSLPHEETFLTELPQKLSTPVCKMKNIQNKRRFIFKNRKSKQSYRKGGEAEKGILNAHLPLNYGSYCARPWHTLFNLKDSPPGCFSI